MSNTTDTPITDEAWGQPYTRQVQRLHTMRRTCADLERQLAEAKAEITRVREFMDHGFAKAKKELDEARHALKTGGVLDIIDRAAGERAKAIRQRDEAIEQRDRLAEALRRIKDAEDAPDIDATGEWQTGLHCGVEDRNCRDRYEGADYGHTVGVEKALEWAVNEATEALASIERKEEG